MAASLSSERPNPPHHRHPPQANQHPQHTPQRPHALTAEERLPRATRQPRSNPHTRTPTTLLRRPLLLVPRSRPTGAPPSSLPFRARRALRPDPGGPPARHRGLKVRARPTLAHRSPGESGPGLQGRRGRERERERLLFPPYSSTELAPNDPRATPCRALLRRRRPAKQSIRACPGQSGLARRRLGWRAAPGGPAHIGSAPAPSPSGAALAFAPERLAPARAARRRCGLPARRT